MQSYPPGREGIPNQAPDRAPVLNGPTAPPSKPPDMPTFYADRCDVEMSPWGATLVFLESVPMGKGAVRANAAVHMSLEHLKVIALLAHRILKQHEDVRLGGKRLVIPADTLKQFGLEDEAW